MKGQPLLIKDKQVAEKKNLPLMLAEITKRILCPQTLSHNFRKLDYPSDAHPETPSSSSPDDLEAERHMAHFSAA